MFTFKSYLDAKEVELFREEMFFQHSLSRAISEAEWCFPEQLAEELLAEKLRDFPAMTANGTRQPIQHRSDGPGYNKEFAYRHYGTPVEDKDASAAAIQKHVDEHGKQPGAQKAKALRVFVHNTDPKTAGGFTGIVRNYGAPDQTPISDSERKKEAESNFDSFSELRKTNPKGYKEKIKIAKAKHLNGKIPDPLLDTTKSETISVIRGNHESEHNGHVSLGFSGLPDERVHITNSDGSGVCVNACHGKGNCVNACLAKGGRGNHDSTLGQRQIHDQMDSHNSAARHDHDLLMYHQLLNMGLKAKKQGKGAMVRPDTTTGHQAYTHAQAIAKHFGPESEAFKNGEIQKVKVNTYGKTTGTDKDVHDMKGQAINITASDQGIPTSPGAIAAHQRLTAALRQKGVPSATNPGSRSAFTVIQVAHPKGVLTQHDAAEYGDKQKQADYEKAKGVHTVRRYDITPSAPKKGEAEEYHDEKSQSGRVVHGGKSYYYTDHSVPRPMETITGEKSPTYMHDNRGEELSRHHEENPNAHGINPIAMATSSTKMDQTEVGKSIFHPLSNVDHSGILHVLHPSSPEAEKAREIVSKSSRQK